MTVEHDGLVGTHTTTTTTTTPNICSARDIVVVFYVSLSVFMVDTLTSTPTSCATLSMTKSMRNITRTNRKNLSGASFMFVIQYTGVVQQMAISSTKGAWTRALAMQKLYTLYCPFC